MNTSRLARTRGGGGAPARKALVRPTALTVARTGQQGLHNSRNGYVTVTGVMGDSEWVTVTQAAMRLGVSRAAIYNRVKRGSLISQSDNHGHQLVKIPATVTPATVTQVTPVTVTPTLTQGTHQEPATNPQEAPGMVPASVVAELIKAHQQALAAAETRHQQALATALQSMAERHRQHLDHVTRQHQTSMALLIERIDRSEVLIDQLLEDRRPWWRRWLGR